MINFETFIKLNTEEKFNLFEKVYQQNVQLNILPERITVRKNWITHSAIKKPTKWEIQTMWQKSKSIKHNR